MTGREIMLVGAVIVILATIKALWNIDFLPFWGKSMIVGFEVILTGYFMSQ